MVDKNFLNNIYHKISKVAPHLKRAKDEVRRRKDPSLGEVLDESVKILDSVMESIYEAMENEK